MIEVVAELRGFDLGLENFEIELPVYSRLFCLIFNKGREGSWSINKYKWHFKSLPLAMTFNLYLAKIFGSG